MASEKVTPQEKKQKEFQRICNARKKASKKSATYKERYAKNSKNYNMNAT